MDSYPRQYLYRRVVRAKLYIDENYRARVDLSNIADEACFSKFHFIRIFKAMYGKTPHQYLTHVRVHHAKLLLADGEPVARVCYTVGFHSVTSFTALFKRRTGLTPAAYQVEQLEKKAEINERPLKFVPNCFVEKRGWIE
jgi:AraC-like DNA-binding protein